MTMMAKSIDGLGVVDLITCPSPDTISDRERDKKNKSSTFIVVMETVPNSVELTE